MVLFNGSYSVGDSECVTMNISALSDNLVEGTESFAVDLDKLNTTVTIFIIDNDCKCTCIVVLKGYSTVYHM